MNILAYRIDLIFETLWEVTWWIHMFHQKTKLNYGMWYNFVKFECISYGKNSIDSSNLDGSLNLDESVQYSSKSKDVRLILSL